MTELKRIRQMVGMNQEVLANHLSISQSQYSRIETMPQEASVIDIIKVLLHLKKEWDVQFSVKLNVRQVMYRIAAEHFNFE